MRRETGKEQVVEVHYDEDLANHIGPESCAVIREGVGEALTGECVGQPLSREIVAFSGADDVLLSEGNMNGCANASARTTRRGRRPWHVHKLLAREPGGLTFGQQLSSRAALVRIGKAWSRSR